MTRHSVRTAARGPAGSTSAMEGASSCTRRNRARLPQNGLTPPGTTATPHAAGSCAVGPVNGRRAEIRSRTDRP